MLRPTFTVKLKDNIDYDANHLAVVKSQEGSRLTFECSGQHMDVSPADVLSVTFNPVSTAGWCPWCDGRIDGLRED